METVPLGFAGIAIGGPRLMEQASVPKSLAFCLMLIGVALIAAKIKIIS